MPPYWRVKQLTAWPFEHSMHNEQHVWCASGAQKAKLNSSMQDSGRATIQGLSTWHPRPPAARAAAPSLAAQQGAPLQAAQCLAEHCIPSAIVRVAPRYAHLGEWLRRLEASLSSLLAAFASDSAASSGCGHCTALPLNIWQLWRPAVEASAEMYLLGSTA